MQAFIRQLRLSLRGWLLLVAVLAWLPMLVFSLAASLRLVGNQQTEALEGMRRRADAAALAVSGELLSAGSVLHTVAATQAARDGALPELHATLLRVVQSDSRISSVSLVNPGGERVLSTLRPLGERLAPSRLVDQTRAVFDSGATVVFDLVTGSISGEQLVGVAKPVEVNGQIPHALRLMLHTSAIGKVLNNQVWNPAWTATVVDGSGLIVARVPLGAGFVGQRATESQLAGVAIAKLGSLQPFESVTKDGTPVVMVAAPVAGTPWWVTVGQPQSQLRQDLHQATLPLAALGLLCGAVAVASSLLVARALAAQPPAAKPAGPGVLDSAHHHPVRELDTLARRLQSAQHDVLTGLPTRALFLQQAQPLLQRVATDTRLSLTVMFMDLDGFKAVNDSQGHDAGDALLKAAADVLRHCSRTDDLAARWGGDEFVLCLCTSAQTAAAVTGGVATRLLQGMRGLGQGMGCSVGIASWRGNTEQNAPSLATLLEAADQAMLQAKQQGKNTVVRATAGPAPGKPGT
jgi:diguanylate cyclase (GGDEF)-like protein